MDTWVDQDTRDARGWQFETFDGSHMKAFSIVVTVLGICGLSLEARTWTLDAGTAETEGT